ncbi:MAG: hypothetical protein ACRD1Z_06815, partial [Vicinamibacteria bacterium]
AQIKLRFSGFGDFIAGYTSGDYADPDARGMFEAFGDDTDPVNTNRGFGLSGTDFVVIADMTEALSFIGEVNLQTGRGGSNEIEIDVERFFVDYLIDPKFNLQAGLFFTPIGYNNRFLYARAWLMNSIQVPDFYEEELNLVPTHSIGVLAHGEFSLGGQHRLGYAASVGNGRAAVPDSAVYARDPSRSKEVTGLVEWLIPGYGESRIGVSGWYGGIEAAKIDNPGDFSAADDTQALEMSERGLDLFLVVNTKRFSVNAEIVRSVQTDRLGNLASPTYTMKGGLAEASLHVLDARLHPYVRYDKTILPDGGGPYLSLRENGGDGFVRVFVPEFEAVMGGAAFDVNAHLRLKVELIRHMSGPREKYGLAFQSAFGF